jgi:hypothetical protein
MPIPQLRKKKGISIKDLPAAKRKAMEEILEKTVEEIADAEFDEFVLIRLKQFAANLMFEFIDYCLDWASPLKCEVSFGPKPTYADHPSEGTRLKRVGSVSPFYPFPPPNNVKGCISADLVINEYRKKPTGKKNLIVIVEIKFQGDKIDRKQFDQYEDLLKAAGKVKTEKSPVRHDNDPVSSGGHLSLFRYPEDKPPTEETDEEKKQRENSTQQTNSPGKTSDETEEHKKHHKTTPKPIPKPGHKS